MRIYTFSDADLKQKADSVTISMVRDATEFAGRGITAGMTTNVNAQIAKVIDTTGFVSADFHVHSIDSPDSETTREERVVSMLAEGVDFFASTDHDFRSDFQPDIVALGATSRAGGECSAARQPSRKSSASRRQTRR